VSDIDILAQTIEKTSGLMLVVTGAGVSHASGIPTFRGPEPDAVWARDTMELATLRYFMRDPAGSWKWYLERFDQVLQTQPNPGHLALAALEQWRHGRNQPYVLITQNVDPLHERAGTRALIKVHGSADRVRCSVYGCEFGAPEGSLSRDSVDLDKFRRDPIAENIPRCPSCGALVRQHVLWFDEYYHGHKDYRWERVQEAASQSQLVLFVGTSFSVGVTELLLDAASRRGVPVFSVDPNPGAVPDEVHAISAPAEELLPLLVRMLTARP
jgi:NAD-dependent deacetylase